jgi:hypothetical protein
MSIFQIATHPKLSTAIVTVNGTAHLATFIQKHLLYMSKYITMDQYQSAKSVMETFQSDWIARDVTQDEARDAAVLVICNTCLFNRCWHLFPEIRDPPTCNQAFKMYHASKVPTPNVDQLISLYLNSTFRDNYVTIRPYMCSNGSHYVIHFLWALPYAGEVLFEYYSELCMHDIITMSDGDKSMSIPTSWVDAFDKLMSVKDTPAPAPKPDETPDEKPVSTSIADELWSNLKFREIYDKVRLYLVEYNSIYHIVSSDKFALSECAYMRTLSETYSNVIYVRTNGDVHINTSLITNLNARYPAPALDEKPASTPAPALDEKPASTPDEKPASTPALDEKSDEKLMPASSAHALWLKIKFDCIWTDVRFHRFYGKLRPHLKMDTHWCTVDLSTVYPYPMDQFVLGSILALACDYPSVFDTYPHSSMIGIKREYVAEFDTRPASQNNSEEAERVSSAIWAHFEFRAIYAMIRHHWTRSSDHYHTINLNDKFGHKDAAVIYTFIQQLQLPPNSIEALDGYVLMIDNAYVDAFEVGMRLYTSDAKSDELWASTTFRTMYMLIRPHLHLSPVAYRFVINFKNKFDASEAHAFYTYFKDLKLSDELCVIYDDNVASFNTGFIGRLDALRMKTNPEGLEL